MKRPDGREEDTNERILRERAWRRDPLATQAIRFFERDGVAWVEVKNDPTSVVQRPAVEEDRLRWSPEWRAFRMEGRR